jgi:hypothetical protein
MPAAALAGYLQTTVINSAGRLQSSGFNGRLVQRLVVGEPFGDPQGIGSRKRRCRPGQKAKFLLWSPLGPMRAEGMASYLRSSGGAPPDFSFRAGFTSAPLVLLDWRNSELSGRSSARRIIAQGVETTGSNGSYWTVNSSIRSEPEERLI